MTRESAAECSGRMAWMKRGGFALVSMCMQLTGCCYLDPLNKPPVLMASCAFADGRRCDSSSDVHRGDRIELRMVVTDPDDNLDAATYGWKAFACTGNS